MRRSSMLSVLVSLSLIHVVGCGGAEEAFDETLEAEGEAAAALGTPGRVLGYAGTALVQINPDTGATISGNTGGFIQNLHYGSGVVDSVSNRLYQMGSDYGYGLEIVTVDTVTGAWLQHADTGTWLSQIRIQRNSQGSLVGVHSELGLPMRFSKVNPSTGTITVLNSSLPVATVVESATVLNPATNRYYVIGTDSNSQRRLITINAITGALVSNLPIAVPITQLRVAQGGQLVGLHAVPGVPAKFCKINPSTGAVTAVSVIPQLTSVNNNPHAAALDVAVNRFYVVGTISGSPGTIFTLDAATGVLLDAAPLTHYISSLFIDN